MKSRLVCSGLVCPLLLFYVFTFVQSDKRVQIEPNHWVDLSSTSWPSEHTPNLEVPFLVYHNEYENGKLFGFNQDKYNQSNNWITAPKVSFKFWTSDQIYFRSRKPSNSRPEIDLKLEPKTWIDSEKENSFFPSLKSISKETWNALKFESYTTSTTAFKDVSVKYVESIENDPNKADPITAYTTDAKALKPVNFEDPISTLENLAFDSVDPKFEQNAISFSGNKVEVFILDKATPPLKFKKIKFTYEKNPSTNVFIEITPGTQTKCNVINDAEKIFENSECKNGIVTVLKTKIVRFGFKISNIQGYNDPNGTPSPITIDKLNAPVLQIDNSQPNNQPNSKIYKIKEPIDQYTDVKGFIRLSETMTTGSDGNDNCYKITKNDEPFEDSEHFRETSSSVELHMTLENAHVGFKLNTITNNKDLGSKEICISDYVSLQNIGKYMITLIAKGEMSNKFSITVATSVKNKIKTLVAPKDIDLKNPKWFFYNPNFEMILNTADIKADLYACDVISSCYPFTPSVEENNLFVLTNSVKNELSKSPFYQIRGTSQSAVTFATSIVEQTQKAFNKEFIEKNELYLNENSVKDAKTKPTDLSYLLKFDQSNENKAEISVSLDTIDLRFQELIMHIKLVNIDEHGNDVGINRAAGGDQKSKLIFNSVSLKKYTENDLFVFPPQEMGSDAKIAFDTFTLSSKDLFFIRPTQMKHTGNSGTFTLQLKTDSPPKPVFVRVRFEIKNFGERKLKENASLNPTQNTNSANLDLLHEAANSHVTTADINIKQKETKFFYTEFIENSYDNIKLTDSGLKLDFTIKVLPQAVPAKYNVYRVILDQGYPKYLQIIGAPDAVDKTILKISDSIKPDSTQTLKGPYRVLYIIHSKETVDAKLKITEFKMMSVKTAPANPNTKTKLSLAYVNQNYEKAACVYDNEPTTDTNTCTLSGFNRITDDRCNMRLGCSNIFEFQLPTSVAIPTTGNEKQFAPYQLKAPKEGQTFNLKVNRKPTSDSPKPDFCIPFTYSANVTALRVTVDGLSFTAIDYPVTPNGKFVDTKVCASWFTNNVDVVEKLVFSFVNQELDIDNHYVKFDDYTTITEENPYNGKPVALSTGIYIDNKDNTDDTLFFESQHWKFSVDPKKLSNSLVYTILANVLESFINIPNTKNGKTPLYYEVLRSRWIQIPKAGAKLKISLTYKSEESDKDKIVESLIGTAVSSQGGTEIPIDFKSTPLNILPNSVFGEYYQFKIKVVLNLTTVAKLKNDHKLNDLTLKIENFSINDPCVDNLNKLQTCSSNDGTTGHNRCIRMYTQTDYRPVCNCTENATGDFCEKIDYCKRDKRICGALKCTNDYIFGGVSCECVSPQEWNPFFKGCIDPQELVCEQNRRPHYEPNHNKKMKCVCLEGFVEMPLNSTTTVTTCEPLNVCDPKHRRIKHFIPEKPCVSPNATCEAVGTKTQDKDYKCNCNSGFSNEHGVHESWAVCLPDDVCSGCQYRCKQSGNTFKCDEQDCDPIGFKFNTSTKKCDFDGKLYSSKFNCVSAELGADKKPVCKCLAGQALDPVTQKCVDHCDDSAKAACQARGAPICDFDSVKKVPVCECKNTDIPYTTDQVNASNWKCMSKCDLLALPDLYEARCSVSFEHCNTDYETDLPLAPLRVNGPKTLPAVNGPVVKNDIFVFNVSKVDTAAALSTSDPTKGQKLYCSCNLGFNWDSKRCVPSSVPTHTISGFEFDLVPTPNIQKYINTVKAAFSKLIATIVGIKEEELIGTKCEKATDTTILCSTSFQSEMTNENIAKKLNTACVRVANDKNKCYYVVDPKQAPHQQFNNFITRSISAISSKDNLPIETYKDIFSSQETNILIHDSKTTRVETEDVCKNPKTCSQYAYSVCTHDKENIKPFECLCPTDKTKDFFQILGSEYVEASDKNKNSIKLTMQTCGIADLCKTNKEKYGCTADDAHCHSQVELDEKTGYKGFTYCTCPNTGAILSDRSLSCKESCDGSCSNNTVSCGRDYLNIKKVICNCKDGFTGTKCEKKAAEAKKEAEASSSKAYLISTIVVSVIAAIALTGLAVLYFKRR